MTPAEAAARETARIRLDAVRPFDQPITGTTCVDLESAAPHNWQSNSGRSGQRCESCGLLRHVARVPTGLVYVFEAGASG